jgi:hypothetical protein
LDDAVVFARGLDELAALGNVVATRLLDVHVLARLTGPDGQQRVPVVGSGDRNDVQVLVIQNRAEVLNAMGRVAAALLHRFATGCKQPGVGIDQICNLDVLHPAEGLDVRRAPAVDAGHGDANAIVGAQHLARRFCAADGKRSGGESAGRGPFQKITTILARHDSLLAGCVA